MRILFVSDVYFPRVNGVSTSIKTFTHALQRLGHEVTLIAPDYGDNGPPDARIERIPARVVPYDPEDRLMARGAVLARTERLRGMNFDVVHIHTPFVAHYAGRALARALELPTVESYHTFFEEYLFHYVPLLPKAWLRALARRFSRAQCNEVNAVVVPSSPMHEVLLRYGVRTPMEILPTGMELDQFTGGDGVGFRARHGIAPQRPVLLHVGRVAFEKNIDFLLRVLDRVRHSVPDVLLIIAGEGPAQTALQRQAAKLKLDDNIRFLGYMDRDTELLNCYRAADIKVFASRTETQGLVLLEAMALGCPVVSTAIMGTRDVLKPGCGAAVVNEEPTEYADAVVRVLRDADLRARMGREGMDYVRAWSADALASRLVTLYGAVIDARREPAPNGASA
jgi:glycosyltransferase involved in cell wall biosynthesis